MEPQDQENEEQDFPDDPEAAQDVERQWLGDHPELAPDESRISVVTGEDLEKESIRRTANTGDIVDDAGDAASGAGPNPELAFDQSSDYMGSEASGAETEDFDRGSPGKLWREEAIGAGSGEPADQEEPHRPVRASHSSDWTAVLGRLGGSSPGSPENLQLADMFASVHFPASREDVLRCLPAVAELHVRTVSVDVREAITDARASSFRSLYDLIDAVKDEIRRAEKRHSHPA